MKRLFATLITILIFALIYSKVDWNNFVKVCSGANLFYLSVAATFFVITTFVSIVRWQLLLKEEVEIPLKTASKIFLAAMSLNSVTPSKMGDLTKAYFLKKENLTGLKRGFDTVFLEKLLDLSSLCFLFLLGVSMLHRMNHKLLYLLVVVSSSVVIFTAMFITLEQKFNPLNYFLKLVLKPFPGLFKLVEDTQMYISGLKKNRARLFTILFISVALWALHLIQIYFFFRTLGAGVNLVEIFGLVPAAILIGLIPITLGGMGTRDAALIYLFSSRFGYDTMAGIGLLVSTRYWVPSLVGLPFLRAYVSGSKEKSDSVMTNPAK